MTTKKDKLKDIKRRIVSLEYSVGIDTDFNQDLERRTREAFQRIADALEISLNEIFESRRVK